jgi:hypothetical protein
MATLGDKVTDTIVGALGKGVSGFTLAQHADMKAIIGPRIEQYLSALPDDSPLRAELEHMQTDSTFSDAIVTALGMVVGMIGSLMALGDPYVEGVKAAAWYNMPSRRLSASEAIKGWWWEQMTELEMEDRLREQGYGDIFRPIVKQVARSPLSLADIREAFLHGYLGEVPPETHLKRHGFNPWDVQVLIKLFEQHPSVGDALRFAGRGAYNENLVKRFGTDGGMPGEVSQEMAEHGIAEANRKYYWRSHYALPGIGQAIDMLFRGIINEEDLDLLLEAQEMAPFWRDKIKQQGYSPLPRVAIRQMMHLGILTDTQALEAYKALGFKPEVAQQMVDYARAFYGVEDGDPTAATVDYTKSEILTAYRKRIITADQARVSLKELGFIDSQVEFYLAAEDLKATQTRKEAYIDRWHSLYIEGIATADEVTTGLVDVGVTEGEVYELLPLWYLERIQRVAKPTRAELNRFLKKDIITEARWTQELQLMGYSDEYIGWYLADAQAE